MIIIPKQFYVGRKEQTGNETPLAFLTPYDDNTTEAFKKRKQTVESWVRGYYDDKKKKLEAIILDNTPVDGFKIAEEVRRHYWGGGNVVWRMVDPRGWEFEISSANLARILDCTSVVKGVIQGKCILGRERTQNLLLPEGSEPYQEAVVNTTRVGKKISVKDVKPGDVVILKDGREGVYLGMYSVAYTECKSSRDYGYGSTTHTTYKLADIKRRHFFHETVTEELKDKLNLYDAKVGEVTYTAVADPHISIIKTVAEQALDTAKEAESITKMLQSKKTTRWDNLTDAYFVTDKLIKSLTLKEAPSSMEELNGGDGKRPFTIVRIQDRHGLPHRIQINRDPSPSSRYHVYLVNVDNALKGEVTYMDGNSTIDTQTAMEAVWTKIVAEYEGKQYRILVW